MVDNVCRYKKLDFLLEPLDFEARLPPEPLELGKGFTSEEHRVEVLVFHTKTFPTNSAYSLVFM